MRLIFVFVLSLTMVSPATAQTGTLQEALQVHAEDIASPSRRTIQPVLDDLAASQLPGMPRFLERWAAREVVQRDADGLFFYGERDGDDYILTSIEDETEAGISPRGGTSEVRPNAGVRRLIGTALVQFRLNDPDPALRRKALSSLARSPSAELLAPLRASIEGETDAEIAALKSALDNRLTTRFAEDPAERIAAIEALSQGVAIADRATLAQILTVRRTVSDGPPLEEDNVAKILQPGDDLTVAEAHALLVEAELAEAPVDAQTRDTALIAAIEGDQVAGTPVATLDTEAARWNAYAALTSATVPKDGWGEIPMADFEGVTFYDRYTEPDAAVTDAASAALAGMEARLTGHKAVDLGLDALSLASIYFLAAIGLAVTFGVMGVINMAHGEFIMIGSYTGYVVQLLIPDYTLSLIVALPMAFLVAAAAGIALERMVIRYLMHRPLETLLATFGISVALQQIAKNVFGTQAVPLTSPDWLAGSWIISDAIGISWIRVAIFVLALAFLALIVFILRRTRLGLEVRAVTQNPGMAASMGIDPGRIGMLTFGLGSGIAGVAGVAIGLYAQVTSEMGAAYIVQSFMTVVVGGVGSVFGTLAGAGMIGGFQKGIEWLNPTNTLAAQTYMILFVIAFIQFRPRGIVPQKGRFAP
ncbi:urea ABC transporter permease subunit UrtB [Aestuariibius insulae]|uniref:urea ABC transporter permease subunit UrtB n=1 Tax=Aestuariibius insulae TaxID=2058287 RepID=UPI00345E4613